MHALLAELNETTGQTMVVVTHDPGLSSYARRVVRLEDKRIVEEREEEAEVSRPGSPVDPPAATS